MAEGTGDLSSLFQNRLFLQYLDAAGRGLATGEGVKPISDVTQQSIKNQSLMQLLKSMLGGGVPGGKLTADEKGMSFNLPKTALGDLFQGTEKGSGSPWEGLAPPLGSKEILGRATTPTKGAQYANPFGSSQPDLTASDLAGLDPQTIMSVVGAAQSQQKLGLEREQLANKGITDIVDIMYKHQLMQESAQRTKKSEKDIEAEEPSINIPEIGLKVNTSQYLDYLKTHKKDPLDTVMPVNVPNQGYMSIRQWNALPEDMKKYSMFYDASISMGDEDPMSKEEFEDMKPTEQERFINHAMKKPELLKIAKDLKSDFNINLTADKARTLEQVKRESKILDPAFAQNVLEDLQKPQNLRNWNSSTEAESYAKTKGIPYEEAKTKIQRAKHREALDKQIKSVFPKAEWKKNGWYVDGELLVRDPYVE